MPAAERTLDRSDEISGRWVSARIVSDDLGHERVRIETGTTGNRLDPSRRVRRRGHDLLLADERIELRSWWPVQEVRTHVVGHFVGDLHGDLRVAGSQDADADLATIDRLTAGALGEDDHAPDLVARVLRSAYPLLRHPIELGARPREVPVPVELVLHHADPRAAARATLGPRVTRPLVRALANSLLPDGQGRIAWEPLVFALMAADRCGPERLTEILETPARQPGAVAFSVTDLERARAMFDSMQPRRIADLLRDALGTDGGTADFVRRLSRHNARPPAPPREPPAPPRPVATRPAEPVDPADRPIDYPTRWRAAAGERVGDLRVVLPTTGNELMDWGAAMENCLGAYRVTVAVQRTRIIGFADGDRLRYAAEISASGALRQLEAPGNTRPVGVRETMIVSFLREWGLIHTDARRDEPF